MAALGRESASPVDSPPLDNPPPSSAPVTGQGAHATELAPRLANSRRRPLLSPTSFLLLCLSLLVAAAMPGCGGCTPDDDAVAQKKKEEEEKKKKKEKPKEDFEVTRLRVQPYGDDDIAVRNRVKPGHWLAAHVQMKANNFHFNAELDTATVDQRGVPLPVEHTPFRMTVSRPAALPKGQIKDFESTYYVPRYASGSEKSFWLQSKLRSAGGGREVAKASQMQPTTRMPDYQYHLVILSTRPERYRFLQRLESVEPAFDEIDAYERERIRYFQIAMPNSEGRIPLPSHPLAWTSIAYLVWDGLDPDKLDPDQQRSLLDWLHWGGQLIVSGPNSLDTLRGSFLDPYLPTEFVQSIDLDEAALAPLSQGWRVHDPKTDDDFQPLSLDEGKPLLGVEMKPRPQASAIPDTGGLVWERRAGLGRTVVTAFPLADRKIATWDDFDSFFNGCLLRRPRRIFVNPSQDDHLREIPYTYFDVNGDGRHIDDEAGYEYDARLSTMVRYFSRDVGQIDAKASNAGEEIYVVQQEPVELPDEMADGFPPYYYDQAPPLREPVKKAPRYSDVEDPRFAGYVPIAQSGVAGWNDYNGCPTAARDTLRSAAGISIPKSGFVLRVLGVYLLILVPVNWALFRLIGRVEWAWIAAPLIAVAGGVAVVRFAQLDIGFARARTELAVLEVQGDYPRAHLTRYSAVYTSLSTAYDMAMSDESSLAQPFAVNPGGTQVGREIQSLSFRHDAENVLSGFQVASNSTGMLHSEQMFALGGAMSLRGNEENGWSVENGSSLALSDVAVLRLNAGGRPEIAWLGDLAAKTSVLARFEPAPTGQLQPVAWEQSPATAKPADENSEVVSLWRLLDLATRRLRLLPGEVRLIGWTDDSLRGVEFHPDASQVTARTLVLAHLRPAELPPARPDVNRNYKRQPQARTTKDVEEEERSDKAKVPEADEAEAGKTSRPQTDAD
ncbi:MAG: hypothetical protein RIC55_04135 [Pirellulaceae bacterium]